MSINRAQRRHTNVQPKNPWYQNDAESWWAYQISCPWPKNNPQQVVHSIQQSKSSCWSYPPCWTWYYEHQGIEQSEYQDCKWYGCSTDSRSFWRTCARSWRWSWPCTYHHYCNRRRNHSCLDRIDSAPQDIPSEHNSERVDKLPSMMFPSTQ